MLQETIIIQNKLGLHTRASAKLVALAASFESQIELKRDNHTANCKSIMAMILLGATKNMQLDLIISGADEFEARDAIVNLINHKFDETE